MILGGQTGAFGPEIWVAGRAMTSVRALFFDVFGTLVDWRTGVAREAERVLRPLGYNLDWTAFADAWRGEYQPGMEEVRSGRIPFCKLDVLHRRNLERFMPRFGLRDLSGRRVARTDTRLAPARCLAGSTGGAEAAQEKVFAGAGLERKHFIDGRSRAPQRFSPGTRSSAQRLPAITNQSRASISPPAKRSISSPRTA